ncbi:MAG TPA: 3'-5' exonuclease [Bacteroidales bacterium]|nr:3'-5' exonuclease [Bacteroidales bacterium]
MIDNLKLNEILFLDIETVPICSSMEEMPESFQNHWEKKSAYFRTENESAADVFQKAGIYSEFGRIVCISVGYINNDFFRVKSFADDNEKKLLTDFSAMIYAWDKTGSKSLCGHNLKEFDVPYIARRMLVNGMSLPPAFNIAGKKPWEVKHLDTLELWKFGDYKHFTSLALLADLFEIPTPKDDIDGSQVYEVYYKEKDIERILRYCEKDVLCVANLLLRFLGKPIIPIEKMQSV